MTAAYCPPEMRQAANERFLHSSSDLWSLSLTLYEFAEGNLPQYMSPGAPFYSATPHEYQEFMNSMLKVQPRDRPSDAELEAEVARTKKLGSYRDFSHAALIFATETYAFLKQYSPMPGSPFDLLFKGFNPIRRSKLTALFPSSSVSLTPAPSRPYRTGRYVSITIARSPTD